MWLALGLLVPFAGTVLGAAMVYLLRGEMNALWNKLLLGFAAGVMVAASVWSLLIPSMQISEPMGKLAWVPAAVGFVLGVLFLLLLDTLIPHLHAGAAEPEGVKQVHPWKRTTMLAVAVTLHNIPEGMAVGVILAGMLEDGSGIGLSAALALSIGIAIQNFPEGAILSLPLRSEGMSRTKAFGIGALSGVVEPVAGLITILLFAHIAPALPYLLAFAAGAMMYVVVEELIPESQAEPHTNIPTLGFTAGFVLMMILDVALG
ncbi:MAG: ZIP family metal transporter [Paludibacteraceae bacterium]